MKKNNTLKGDDILVILVSKKKLIYYSVGDFFNMEDVENDKCSVDKQDIFNFATENLLNLYHDSEIKRFKKFIFPPVVEKNDTIVLYQHDN